MPTPLEQSLYRVLAYFAYFQFPLTTFELWKWCDVPTATVIEIEEVLVSLSWLRSHGCVSEQGFFALGDAVAWRAERLRRVTDALRKSRRASRFVKFASRLPWVKMIAVCNSLAFSFTNNESDIDLFVVTERGKIWSTRLILAGALAFMRARPGERANDPLCLSFFVADDRLDLSSVKIGPKDPYLMFWIATLSPLLDRGDILAKLRVANGWMRPDVPRAHGVRRARSYAALPVRAFPDLFNIERIAERMQRARFPLTLRTMMNADTRVVVTDGMLKFHHNDRRQDILETYETLLSKLDDVLPVRHDLSPAVANTMDV